MKIGLGVALVLAGLVAGYCYRDRATKALRQRSLKLEERIERILAMPIPGPDTVVLRQRRRVDSVLVQRQQVVVVQGDSLPYYRTRDSLAGVAIDSLLAVVARQDSTLTSRDSLLQSQRISLIDCRDLLADWRKANTGSTRSLFGIPLPTPHLGAEYDGVEPFVYAGAELRLGGQMAAYGDLTVSQQRSGWRAGVRVAF